MRGSSDNRPIILELSRAKGTLMLAVLRIAFALGLMFCVDVVTVPDISFADADTGLLGTTWATVQKNEFFDFFHLAEVARRSDQGYTIVDYRPTGGDFGSLVRVEAKWASNGTLEALTLVILRNFIDGSSSTFARDIAKSFILDVPSQADAQGLSALVGDITADNAASRVRSSADYAVFLGQSSNTVIRVLRNGKFQMRPVQEGNVPALQLTFTH